MAWSAAGRVYLSQCADSDRRRLLRMEPPSIISEGLATRQSVPPILTGGFSVVDTSRAGAHSALPADLDSELARIRRDGFAILHTAGTVFFTLAVPIMVREAPIGAIAVHVFRTVLSPSDAIASLLKPLQEAAGAISCELRGRVS